MDPSQYLALLRHARTVNWSDSSVDLSGLEQQLEDAVAQVGHTAPPDAERFATLFFASPEGREYQQLTAHDPARALARDSGRFAPSGPSANDQLAGKKILIVDDQPCVINTVRPFLEMWGMEVVATTDPQDALQKLLTEDYDLLITDLVMPELDGVNLLNELIAKNRFIPTLVLSGSQGNRQAALLHHELSNGFFRDLDLPLLYMKKEHENFSDGLQDRLTYLSGKPRFKPDDVAKVALPKLRSVIAHEMTTKMEETGLTPSVRERQIWIGQLADRLCDLRFALLVESAPVLTEITSFAATLEESKYARNLGGVEASWRTVPLRPRQELLTLDDVGWHNFKGETQAFWRLLDGVFICFKRLPSVPEELKRKVQVLYDKAYQLARLTSDIQQLSTAGKGDYVLDPFKNIPLDLVFVNLGKKIDTDLPIQVEIKIRLPGNFVLNIISQLGANAVQATPVDSPKPRIKARIIEAENIFAEMQVRPEDKDAVGGRFRPSPEEIRRRSSKYLYIGVVNASDTLFDATREHMLQTRHFTTKTFGSGLGLAIVREQMKGVNGWMEVQSRDGMTEVAVFIPIDDRIVPNPPTSGGSPTGEGSVQGTPTSSSGVATKPEPFQHKPDEPGVPDWTTARAVAGRKVPPLRLVSGDDVLVHGVIHLVGGAREPEEEGGHKGAGRVIKRPYRFLPPGVPRGNVAIPLRTLPVGR